MMKSSDRRTVTLYLLALAVAVVVTNFWFASRSINALVRSEYWVDHTWQVINQTELILGSAKDVESATRGFIISGNDAYLTQYFSGREDLPGELDKFQQLTADSPKQQANLVELRAILEERLALFARSVDLRKHGDLASIQATVATGVGRAQTQRLRGVADRMQAEERKLLAIRIAGANASRQQSRLAVGLASVLDLLLILFVFQYLRREQRMRLDAEVQAERLAVSRAALETRTIELDALNATLEERVKLRTAELEATNRELEAFSYSVSHDLRAPLRTIDGFSLALEEDYAAAVDAAGKDYILRVRTGVQRMGQLIDALLQLSRITRAEITKQSCDLTRIANTVATNLKTENPGCKVRFEIEEGLQAMADPGLVQVALENLLGNAVKFSSKVASPEITFGWDTEQQAWFVRDNGAGFDMYYASKLFNAFNRLHGDKDFKGSGIGLATVARVIRRHHGKIWADSVVGHGATFWFTLG